MGLSVPFWRMTDAAVNPPGMDDQFWYIRYFQEEGRVEAELEKDLERSLRICITGSAPTAPAQSWIEATRAPQVERLLDALPEPKQLPSWLTPEDLDYYVEQYRTSGFRGPVNWYRNIPTNNGITPELEARNSPSPAAFVAGAADDVLLYDPNWRATFPDAFKDCASRNHEGAGHWVQAEKPQETTACILRFLRGL